MLLYCYMFLLLFWEVIMNYQLKGKRLLLCISGFIILADIIYTIFCIYNLLSLDTSILGLTLTNSFFRILVEVALVVFCYRGNICAKWILSVIMIALSSFLLLQFAGTSSLFMLIIGLIFLFSAALLFTSPSIKAFMNSQRAK